MLLFTKNWSPRRVDVVVYVQSSKSCALNGMHWCDKNSIFFTLNYHAHIKISFLVSQQRRQYIYFTCICTSIYLCLYTLYIYLYLIHISLACTQCILLHYVFHSSIWCILLNLKSPPFPLHCKVDCYVYTKPIRNPSFLLILINHRCTPIS